MDLIRKISPDTMIVAAAISLAIYEYIFPIFQAGDARLYTIIPCMLQEKHLGETSLFSDPDIFHSIDFLVSFDKETGGGPACNHHITENLPFHVVFYILENYLL